MTSAQAHKDPHSSEETRLVRAKQNLQLGSDFSRTFRIAGKFFFRHRLKNGYLRQKPHVGGEQFPLTNMEMETESSEAHISLTTVFTDTTSPSRAEQVTLETRHHCTFVLPVVCLIVVLSIYIHHKNASSLPRHSI